MYADSSTEYKNYHCKVSSVQNKTAGEPCAQSVTKDGKELILCRPYPILHWKHILFSARGKTPLRDCLEENMTKFFCLSFMLYFAGGKTPLRDCIKENRFFCFPF